MTHMYLGVYGVRTPTLGTPYRYVLFMPSWTEYSTPHRVQIHMYIYNSSREVHRPSAIGTVGACSNSKLFCQFHLLHKILWSERRGGWNAHVSMDMLWARAACGMVLKTLVHFVHQHDGCLWIIHNGSTYLRWTSLCTEYRLFI